MTAPLEQRLLLSARSGDYEAFEHLRSLLDLPVRRFIRRLIGLHDAEDDIVQTVFIALFFNMHKIEPVENLRPYLYRMVRNRCYDELREQGRFDVFSFDEEPTWLSFTSENGFETQPEEVAHWLLLHLEVKEAIQKLPELQRETLILYAEENLSYAEIALVMESNIGTVKSRLHHAKRTLRQLLRPQTLMALESELQGEGDD